MPVDALHEKHTIKQLFNSTQSVLFIHLFIYVDNLFAILCYLLSFA